MPPTEVRNKAANTSEQAARNTVVVLLGQVISLAVNVLVTVLLARYLGDQGFGVFSYAIVYVSLFAIIGDYGLKSIVVRELSRAPQRSGMILGNAILLAFGLGALAVLITAASAALFDFSPQLRTVIWILAANILVTSKMNAFRIIFESLFQARLRMAIPMVLQTLDAALLLILVFLMIKIKASLPTMAAVYVASNVPGFALTVVAACRIAKPEFRRNADLRKMFLQESLPIFIYIILMTLYERMDVMQLKAIRGEAAVGLYASAFRLVNPLSFIPMALASSLYPLMSKFSTSSDQNLDKSFAIGIKILAAIGLPLGLGAAFVGSEIYQILYTAVFWPADNAFKILVWSQIIFFFNFFIANFIVSIDNQRHNIWAALTMCVAVFVLNALLIPRWGIDGAATAKLLANMLGLAVFFHFAYRRTAFTFSSTAIKFIGVALVFIAWLALGQKLNLIVVLILSIIVYALLLILFGVFDEKEKRVLLDFMKRSA